MELPPPPYVLHGATFPLCLLAGDAAALLRSDSDADGCARVDIAVGADGRVASVTAASSGAADGAGAGGPVVDLRGRMCLPLFADLHTHIDKGHTWARSPNPDGSRDGAFAAAAADAELYTPEDLTRRVEFSLRCAYAYGTAAVRTHVVTTQAHAHWVWPIMAAARERWAGRVELQLVGMVAPLTAFAPGGAGPELAKLVASHGGLLGGSLSQLTAATAAGGSTSLAKEALARQGSAHGGVRLATFDALLDAFFAAAVANDLDIDLHVDENGDDQADALLLTCQAAMRHGWAGRVTAGHCCALALLTPEARAATLDAAKAARITVVSLPTVNMYLQDRVAERTPRWRGVTLLHELRAAGVPVAVASDNTRDAFYAYGDLDMLDAFRQGVRIGHLDHPHGDWIAAVTSVPADAMRLPHVGRLTVGQPADMVLLRARSFNEMLARSQHDRRVLRAGVALQATVPEYEELDDLMLRGA